MYNKIASVLVVIIGCLELVLGQPNCNGVDFLGYTVPPDECFTC